MNEGAELGKITVLELFIVADPDPGSGAFLTPGSWMGEKSDSGSGMNNPNHISESLETIFWVKILKFFHADPGWKKIGSGINIPDLNTATISWTRWRPTRW